MRLSAVILAIMMACIWPVQAVEKPAPVYGIDATGTIEIGPDGQVVRHQLDKGQPAAIEQALARNIGQWRFEPIVVDGKPVIARTRMRLAIEALPTVSEDYQLRIRGVWFGEPGRSAHDMRPPPYPRDAVYAGIGAKVVLVLQLDGQGKVQQVHAEQVSLDRLTRSESQAERWRGMFARTSIETAARWKFNISETLAGQPIGTSVRVPVTFSLTEGSRREGPDNVWHSYVPGPRVPAPWIVDTGVASQDVDSLKDGDVQALDSHFKLRNDLVGSLL